MSRKEMLYWEKVRENEKMLFPEFEKENICEIPGVARQAYNYFAPSWHFHSGLITEEDVAGFLADKNKKLLSVGSGPAFLELFLVHLGIDKHNITLSDIDVALVPQHMKSYCFDMFAKWLDFDHTLFDVIIFPESVLINTRGFDKAWQYNEGIYHIISQALGCLSPTGTIKMNLQTRFGFSFKKLEKRLVQDGRKITINYQHHLMEIKSGLPSPAKENIIS